MPDEIENPFAANEPIDGASLVNPRKRFCAPCLEAIRVFRRQRPWQGTLDERKAKLETLHAALCEAYGIQSGPVLEYVAIGDVSPDQVGTSVYDSRRNRLLLAGRLSVASYLWAFARVRGLDATESFRWSLSLFARMFPRSFERCTFNGPFLVRAENHNL